MKVKGKVLQVAVTAEDMMRVLESRAADVSRRYGVRRLGLFGSVARLEAAESSDADVLVDFEVPSFDGYMDLKFELEDLLGRPVDLVMIESLKPALRDKVLAEVRYVA